MKLSRIIEAPLGDFTKFGDFDSEKGKSFNDKRDRKMLANSRLEDIARKKFGKTPYILNLYFVNRQGLRKFTETGSKDLNWVKENIGEDVAEKIKPHYQEEDNINVVFVSNVADDKHPMTPWIMAHRISHAIYADRNNPAVAQLDEALVQFFVQFLENYGISLPYKKRMYQFSSKEQEFFKYVIQSIGTFRSAKKGNIRNPYELLHELFAQWVISGGNLKFKDAPRILSKGRGNNQFNLSTDEAGVEEANEAIQMLKNTLEIVMNDYATTATEGVLIM